MAQPCPAWKKHGAFRRTKAAEISTGFWDSHLRTQRWQMSCLNSGMVGERGDASRACTWAPASPWPAVPASGYRRRATRFSSLLTLGQGPMIRPASSWLRTAVQMKEDEAPNTNERHGLRGGVRAAGALPMAPASLAASLAEDQIVQTWPGKQSGGPGPSPCVPPPPLQT